MISAKARRGHRRAYPRSYLTGFLAPRCAARMRRSMLCGLSGWLRILADRDLERPLSALDLGGISPPQSKKIQRSHLAFVLLRSGGLEAFTEPFALTNAAKSTAVCSA